MSESMVIVSGYAWFHGLFWLVMPGSLVSLTGYARLHGYCGQLCLVPWIPLLVMPGSLDSVAGYA